MDPNIPKFNLHQVSNYRFIAVVEVLNCNYPILKEINSFLLSLRSTNERNTLYFRYL